VKKISLQWKEPPFGTGRLRIKRATWRTTILRLIRAEQETERVLGLFEQYKAATDAVRPMEKELALRDGQRQGREDVLRLIGRWGRAVPLAGYNGEQMAEALRKIVTPTIVKTDETNSQNL
jgi:hypothetical protein